MPMNVATIAAKFLIPPRTVRYVLDHDMVPGLPANAPGRGRGREFRDFEAFVVGIAATLLYQEFSAATIRSVMIAGKGVQRSQRKLSFWKLYQSWGDPCTERQLVVACGDGISLSLDLTLFLMGFTDVAATI